MSRKHIDKLPSIMPHIVDCVNGRHERKHIYGYQHIRYNTETAVSDGVNDIDTHEINKNVSIVGCGTSSMTNGDNRSQILRINIPEPSEDNAGYFIYIKDEEGNCGNTGNGSYAPNTINVTYGPSYQQVHTISEAHSFEVIYSTGTSWKRLTSSNLPP